MDEKIKDAFERWTGGTILEIVLEDLVEDGYNRQEVLKQFRELLPKEEKEDASELKEAPKVSKEKQFEVIRKDRELKDIYYWKFKEGFPPKQALQELIDKGYYEEVAKEFISRLYHNRLRPYRTRVANPKNKRITFRVDEEMYESMKPNPSKLVRKLIEKYMEEDKEESA